MKGIELCAECAYYSMKTHKCKRGCIGEPNQQNGDDVRFFTDCPLPEVDVEKKSEWIKCSERMPDEPGIHVLVTDGVHIMESWYEVIDGEMLWVDNYTMYVNIRFGEVTHWRPMLELPKEVDEDVDKTNL